MGILQTTNDKTTSAAKKATKNKLGFCSPGGFIVDMDLDIVDILVWTFWCGYKYQIRGWALSVFEF